MRFFLAISLLCCYFCCQAQQKYVLIVVITDYPKESGWNSIYSDNDLQLLAPQFKRLGSQINTLINKQATKKNITQDLQDLIRQPNPGDDVCLHFSCHGQQMEDDNGDETDGLDGVLIPYDARKTFQKGIYEGEERLRDGGFEKYLTYIWQKTGANGSVLVTLDACHNGTANRIEEYVEDEDALIRDTDVIFTSNPFYIAPDAKHIQRKNRLMQQNGSSPICIISACQPFQRNFEIKVGSSYHGTLSYPFYTILKKIKQWDKARFLRIWKQSKSLSSK